MPIVNTEILNFTLHAGGNRAHVKYTFASGLVRQRPLRNAGIDKASALTFAQSLIPEAEERQQERDAENAYHSDQLIETDAGESTMQQRAIAYLENAMREDDSIIAYHKLKRFNDFRTNQGWTVAQIKAQLNITDNQWDTMTTRYTLLDSNSANITAFEALRDADIVRGG